ncbi:SpoIIE family protein phosphatase [Streptosporangium sp. NPDC048047]|uniref:SpoIIE family protein phosphatase n=1 Tax=Streptosporangium sp. NPDC048047 TaxID=3155748 RepID=UPI00341BBA1B
MKDARIDIFSGLALDIFDPAPVGVSVSRGPDHRLMYTNAAYRSAFGDRPFGVPAREAFADLVERDSYISMLDRVMRDGQPVNIVEGRATMSFAGGGPQERFFNFSMSEICLGGGERGVLQVSVEVTEQVIASRWIDALSEERRRLLRRYRNLGRVGTQMLWVAGADGGVIEPSPGWQKVTGQTWEEFQGDGWLDAVHPDDRAETAESWAKAVGEVFPLWEHVHRLRLADGGYRHFSARAVPVHEDDRVVEWVGTCADIEQQWQQERCRELLGRASAATADVTRLEEMLSALAHVIVPELADVCGIYLLPESPDRPVGPPLVFRHVAGAVRPGLPGLQTGYEVTLGPESALVRAVRRRHVVRREFPRGKPPPDLQLPPGGIRWLITVRATSAALVPVVVDGFVAALVTVATCGDRPAISEADVTLIGQMLDHAHDALSGAMEFQRTQRVALALQRSLLAEPPSVPGLRIVARYRPSPAAAAVGGDWYDCFVLGDGTPVLTIGDVAGHDLPAAVTMGQIRTMLRGLAVDREEPPEEVLRRLDKVMELLCRDQTATCVLARAERAEAGLWRLNYSVAGHPPPLLLTPDGQGRFLDEARCPLLGVAKDLPRHSAVEALHPGATLLLYTDGLVERRGEDLGTGLNRLRDHAVSLVREPLDALCDELLARLVTGEDDDIAMIALRNPLIAGEAHPV